MDANEAIPRKHSRSFYMLVFLMGGVFTATIFLGFYLLNGRYLVMSRISYRQIESVVSAQTRQIKKQDDYILTQNHTLKNLTDRLEERYDYILTQNRILDTQKTQLKERDNRLNRKDRLIDAQMSQIQKQNEYIIAVSKAKKSSDSDLNLYANAGKRLLKELIAKDFPQIANPDLDDWTKVNLLREWTYRNTDWGTGETLIVPESKLNLHGLPPQAIFANFLSDKKGTYCGGISVSLMKLYRMYGFASYAYGMGDPAGFTHTITLVAIEHRGKKIFAVEDAALNMTYATSKGDPLDFFAMLKLLKKHEHERIDVLKGKAKFRDLIVANRNQMETFRDIIVPESSQGQRLPNGNFKCQILVNLDVVEDKFGNQIFSFLKKQKQPSDPIYLFLHPILFDGLGDTDSLSLRTQQIVQAKSVTAKPETPIR